MGFKKVRVTAVTAVALLVGTAVSGPGALATGVLKEAQRFFEHANSVLPHGRGPLPGWVNQDSAMRNYGRTRVGPIECFDMGRDRVFHQDVRGKPFEAHVVGKGPLFRPADQGQGRVAQPEKQLAVALVLKKPIRLANSDNQLMLATVERFALPEAGKTGKNGVVCLTHARGYAVFQPGDSPESKLVFPSGPHGSAIQVLGSPFLNISPVSHKELITGYLTTGYRTFTNELMASLDRNPALRDAMFNDRVHISFSAAHLALSSIAEKHPDLESAAQAYVGADIQRYGDALKGRQGPDSVAVRQFLDAMGRAEAMAWETVTGPDGYQWRQNWYNR